MCLGQRVRAFVFHRVLGGDDEERLGEREAFAFDRHLALLHGFQQGGLGFGWRTVDLVGKQQLGEDRTLAEPKRTGVEIIDVRAEDIGGHQVGRELNTLELGLHQQRNGFRHQRLRGAGDAFEQHMPARKQGDQHVRERVFLPDQHFSSFTTNMIGNLLNQHSVPCTPDDRPMTTDHRERINYSMPTDSYESAASDAGSPTVPRH